MGEAIEEVIGGVWFPLGAVASVCSAYTVLKSGGHDARTYFHI